MQETLTRVSSIAAEGIRLAWGLKGELRKLDESLTMIQAVLQEAATRPVTDKPVKLFAGEATRYEIQRLATRCGLGLTAPQHANGAPEISLDRETESSLERSEVVVGRDGDVCKILNLLMGSIDQQVLPVVPYCGDGRSWKDFHSKENLSISEEKKTFLMRLYGFVPLMISIKGGFLGEMLQRLMNILVG
ncbi:hypothetical protein OIU76_023041 [Salix suchowensis]|nr:hypothetical protein OIU76_023041 [Salix suchowensis]